MRPGHRFSTCSAAGIHASIGKQWYGTGIKTRHDRFVMGMTTEHAVGQVRRVARRSESDEQLMSELHLCTTAHFDLQAARKRAESPTRVLRALVRRVSWRPLDDRFAVWCREFICEPKERTMRHLAHPDNLALAVLVGTGVVAGSAAS